MQQMRETRLRENCWRDATENLAGFVAGVQEELGLSGREFALGKTGGMIGRSNYFDVTLDSGLQELRHERSWKS